LQHDANSLGNAVNESLCVRLAGRTYLYVACCAILRSYPKVVVERHLLPHINYSPSLAYFQAIATRPIEQRLPPGKHID